MPAPAPAPVLGLPADITALPRSGGTVYEHGALFTYPAPNNWAPHADYVVNGQAIKNHYWGARWYDGKFVIKNKISDLVAKKLLPPHSASLANVNVHVYSGNYTAGGLPNPVSYAGPMDYQLPPYMGQTGDNPGIGPFPEHCAAYAATEDQSLAASVEAYARWGMTLPIHVRDPKTGKPVDYRTYPGFSTYPGQDNSMITPALRTGITGNTPDPNGLHWDTAHAPNFFFLAYMLTEDPVWLEELQLAVSFEWALDFPNQGHIGNLQTREMAWNIRDIANCVVATRHAESLGALPDYLLPSAYFMQTMVLPTAAWFKTFESDTSPAGLAKINSVFGAPGNYSPWQSDFLTISLGCGVWMGIEELRPAFNWLACGLVERLTGAQGWNKDYFTFYYLSKPTGDWASSFKELIAEDPRAGDPIPAGQVLPTILSNDYSDYVSWAGAAARVGKLIGHPDLVTLSPTLDAKIMASGVPRNFRHTIGE